MKNRLTENEIKTIQLDILQSIHDFCMEKGLRYSLAYGTLIGAIRHKGYIPWDDDVDIMMPRPDYELFVKEYTGGDKPFVVQTYKNDNSYFLGFAKVYDNRTEQITFPTRTGVFVDVFPIDGLPDSDEDTQKYYKQKLKLIFKNLLYTSKNNSYRPGNKVFNTLKYIVKRILYPSRKRAIRSLDEMVLKYPFEKCKYGGIVVDFDVLNLSDRLKKETFEKFATTTFENKVYNIIENYHSFLYNQYGDYMQLPPEEKRVPGHDAPVYWKI